MTPITGVAKQFFEACETGKGWEGCKAYCKPNATFSAQAEPLADVKTLQQYADWMKGLMNTLPDGRYELKSFATDEDRKNVSAYGVFLGTHTGQGGPCPPTGKKVRTDYVYVIDFDGDKIRHMTKIWHSGLAMKELGPVPDWPSSALLSLSLRAGFTVAPILRISRPCFPNTPRITLWMASRFASSLRTGLVHCRRAKSPRWAWRRRCGISSRA